MIVLGIESTCDETGAALVKDGAHILSNISATSSDIHERYGGVFPELACRRHIDVIIPVIKEALKEANLDPSEIDLIAVARGPGLIGALLIGLNTAKGLSIAWKKPLVGVNHVEAHLYAAMMGAPHLFPALGLVLSGGHTFMVQIDDVGSYTPLGSTVDDAIGEAFDKVASLLNLPYPGGPHVEKLAALGNSKAIPFSISRVKRSPLDLSFSGLKTSVLYAVRKGGKREDIAASFQETAFNDVATKAALALQKFPAQAIYLGGGVCCNQQLRSLFETKFPHLPIYWPTFSLSTDNAAMIAALGYHKFLQKNSGHSLDLEALTRIPIA